MRKRDLPRNLGLVLEVRSGKTDERSGRLRRVAQNMSLLLLPLFGYFIKSCKTTSDVFSREEGISQEVGAGI